MNRNLNDITNDGYLKIVNINGQNLMCFESGKIYRINENGIQLINNIANNNKYNKLSWKNKCFLAHRIIGYAFLGLDIDNEKLHIDHIDGNKGNNNVDNLRIVSHQQNHFNRTTAKGYYFSKANQKFRAMIRINGKSIHIGYYTTESDARAAYPAAKLIYHII